MGIGDLLTQSTLAAALPGMDGDYPAARLAVYALDAAGLLVAALFAFHCASLARLHVRAARARRLLALQAIETTALKRGQPCQVEICGADAEPLKGLVAEVERRHVMLALDGLGPTPRAGSPIVVTVVGPSAAYRFMSVVRDVRTGTVVPTVYVPRPPWVEKVQRRGFFRVPVDTQTSVSARAPGAAEPVVVACKLTDMSAGGVRMVSPVALEAGAALAVRVPTAADVETRFEARVRRCAPCRPGDDRFEIGCEFERIDEETRTRLMCHCFDLERAARRCKQAAEAG